MGRKRAKLETDLNSAEGAEPKKSSRISFTRTTISISDSENSLLSSLEPTDADQYNNNNNNNNNNGKHVRTSISSERSTNSSKQQQQQQQPEQRAANSKNTRRSSRIYSKDSSKSKSSSPAPPPLSAKKLPALSRKLRLVPLENLLQKTSSKTRQPARRQASQVNLNSSVVCLDSDASDSELASSDTTPLVNGNAKRAKQQQQVNPLQFFTKRCVVRVNRLQLPVVASTSSSAARAKGKRVKRKRIIRSSSSSSDMENQSAAEAASSTSSVRRSRRRDPSVSEHSENEDDIASAAAVDAISSGGESGDGKSSDSEVMPVRKKRVFNKRKRSSSNDSDFEPDENNKKKASAAKKRGRVKKNSSDSDEKKNGKNEDGDDDEKNKHKRKHIRKIIKTKDLDISTKTATKEEEERRRRIEERQKIYNKIYEQPESVEVTDLVLDFDEDTKTALLQVDSGLLKKLKPHQVTGVKFMWDACFETLHDVEEKPGSGCILAHCMGLGKTLQVVTLSHTLLTNASKTKVERVLIISPLSTLNNWAREYVHWMGFAKKRNIEVYDMSRYKDKATRIFKLDEWFTEGGVCIIGYDMYRILANEKAKGLRKKQREVLQSALVEPGPDLVICDEGHLLKNEKTSISKAVTKMRTKRRIVLTGTPLQNNLKEYYCMIQFVKPNLLGTYKEYLNRFVNPITNGQYTDSTERDLRLMRHRSHILHKMLEGCIQRRDYSVLAPYLPPKHEYVVYTTLSELQQQLYDYYMTLYRGDVTNNGGDLGGKGARLFQDFQDLRRIWTHPMSLRVNSDIVIRKRLLANESDSMDDFICDDDENEEDTASSTESSVDSSKSFASGSGGNGGGGGGGGSGGDKNNFKKRKTRNNRNNTGTNSDVEVPSADEKDDPSEWWKRFVEEKELNNINHSPKLVILMRLLEQCEAIGDKLLVFSQSLQSLDVIEHFLALIDSKTKGYEYEGDVGNFKGMWTPSIDYFRLDGSCSVEQREAMCKKFNDPKNLRARLFLISTRAGGLGINLVAANRVVIFDVSWNPSHDTQSIFRVYRFGQDKPSYIYRLIAMGTMEQKVYERQVMKQATAKRVIDEQQITRHYNQSDLMELYTYELRPTVEREIPKLPKDRLFAELLSEHENLLFKYHEHDSLLENEESENLSEDERKAAWDEYEAEKTRTVQANQYMAYDREKFAQLGNGMGGTTSNKIFGFRTDVLLQLLNMKVSKDQPDLTQFQVTQQVPKYLERLFQEMNNGDPTIYKDLLDLHAKLVHPSGMYMNPLLYVNQNPEAAGYYQAPSAQQQPQPPPPAGGGAAAAAAGASSTAAATSGTNNTTTTTNNSNSSSSTNTNNTTNTVSAPANADDAKAGNKDPKSGFDPDKVYEID